MKLASLIRIVVLAAIIGGVGITAGCNDARGANKKASNGGNINPTPTSDFCSGIPGNQPNDSDGDGVGDACDPGSGPNNDYCPNIAGVQPTDSDGDGTGDACDPTPKGDLCPTVNGIQTKDPDGDGIGKACEPDFCPKMQGIQGHDRDGDGMGNACDTNGTDYCPNISGNQTKDKDGDGIGNACEAPTDYCPNINGAQTTDSDGDGQGNACDPTPGDLCPNITGNQTKDKDDDGVGNACESNDLCSIVDGLNTKDTDGDGQGDACDPYCSAAVPSPFMPIESPNAVATYSDGALCVLCSVEGKRNVIDDKPANYANVKLGVQLLGKLGAGHFAVTDTMKTFPKGRRVGYILQNPNDLLSLGLGDVFTLSVYKNGSKVGGTDGNLVLNLELLGLIGENRLKFVSFVAPKEFDEVRIGIRSVAGLLNNYRLFKACVSRQ